jgi:hypothetical protein
MSRFALSSRPTLEGEGGGGWNVALGLACLGEVAVQGRTGGERMSRCAWC